MTDLTPILNELLKSHDARPTADPSLSLQNIDNFLREAYEINSGIASLNTELRGIRQSYLSTAPPPRRATLSSTDKQWKHLTDRQREEIDAGAKQLLRDLNLRIQTLEHAEQARQSTADAVRKTRYSRLGLGALGKWAAGGKSQAKSYEEQLEESEASAIGTHRKGVLWFLQQKLTECASFQAAMMEKRILREVEKNRSVLAKSRMGPMPELGGGFDKAPVPPWSYTRTAGAHVESQELYPEQELTPEQVQMLEKENQDMLKHYESTLDQVRTAEKSLVEISELQSQLVKHLATQSEHIDQLVTDSFVTTENVGGGNKQLEKATQRKSTAKYVFYASCGLSVFLVVWDLVI